MDPTYNCYRWQLLAVSKLILNNLQNYFDLDCNTPDTINNGSIQLDVSDSTTYGSTASVSCDTGFDRSRASISCLASGEWQNATCTIRGKNT
jgi:hypothetical protein